MRSGENDQELNDGNSLLHESLVGQSIPYSATVSRQINVHKIQCEKTTIMCSTGGLIILGWDFASGEVDILVARRCVQGLLETSILPQIKKGSGRMQWQ